jgi:hypothetical protein
MDLSRPAIADGPSWVQVAALGLASRCVVVTLGLAGGALPWIPHESQENPIWDRYPHAVQQELIASGPGRWVEPWYRFDANWYAETARSGYSFAPGEESTVAFFPLLPALMAAGAAVGLDPYLVGLLVPNLAFAAGLGFFARAVVAITRDGSLAWKSCVLLTAFPTAFFFSAPYPESLAFLATAVALWGWATGRWEVAALALGLGVLARPNVAVVPVVLLIDRLLGGRLGRPAWGGVVAALVVPAVAYAGFCAYLGERVGDPLAFVRVQEAWGRTSPSPEGLVRGLRGLVDPTQGTASVAVIGFLALGALSFRRGMGWGLLVIAPILQFLATGTPMSAHRHVLICLPAFVEAAAVLRPRWGFGTVVAFLAGLQCFEIMQYTHWHFAG